MNFFSLRAIFSCALLIVSGCDGKDILNERTDSHQPAWSFSLRLDALQLTDRPGKTASNLSLELVNRLKATSYLHDPGENFFYSSGGSAPLVATFLVFSNDAGATEYSWTHAFGLSSNNSFGSCSARVADSWQFVACEKKRLLQCLEREAHAYQRESLTELSSSSENSVLMQWLRNCDVDPQFAHQVDGNVFFKIESDQLLFSPSPLSSLLIFKGSWSSYEDAQVQAVAAASLPQLPDCNRADASCLMSPVPLSQCRGCATLEKGKIHTVFFFEGLRQDYAQMKSVLYIPK